MARPQPVLEIAFVDPPLTANAAATWEDLSDRLRGELQITRGRLNELQDMPAGRMTLTLKNSDRELDPENASSIWYPNVYPMRKIRFGLDWGGTVYWRFCGFIEAWQIRELLAESVVDVRCIDAFKYFNQLKIVSVGTSIPAEKSDERISRVLDAASWPAGDRLIALGDVDIMETNDLDDTALGHMQLVARAEIGALWITRTGNVGFADRTTYTTGSASVATFNNDAAGNDVRYSAFLISYDDSMIYNQIRAWKDGGQAEHIAEDATSQAEYFTRTLSYRDLPLATGGDVDTYADLLLHRYKDARLRPASLTADPLIGNPTPLAGDAWSTVLSLDLTDRVTVLQDTFMNGDTITYDAHIEAISESIQTNTGGYSMTMGLSAHIPGTPATVAAVGDTQWTDATLAGTWANVGGIYPNAGYWKDADNRVYLRGMVSGGTGIIFLLPVHYRPPFDQRFTINASAAAGGISVTQSGNVIQQYGSATNVDLGSVRFLNH